MIKNLRVVRNLTLPWHLPLRATFEVKILAQMKTVMRTPQTFPIENMQPMEEPLMGALSESLVAERKEELREKKASGHKEEAWQIESEGAESGSAPDPEGLGQDPALSGVGLGY